MASRPRGRRNAGARRPPPGPAGLRRGRRDRPAPCPSVHGRRRRRPRRARPRPAPRLRRGRLAPAHGRSAARSRAIAATGSPTRLQAAALPTGRGRTWGTAPAAVAGAVHGLAPRDRTAARERPRPRGPRVQPRGQLATGSAGVDAVADRWAGSSNCSVARRSRWPHDRRGAGLVRGLNLDMRDRARSPITYPRPWSIPVTLALVRRRRIDDGRVGRLRAGGEHRRTGKP